MAVKVKVTNPQLTYEPKTYLTVDYSSGTNLSVRSSNDFSQNYYAVVGEPTQEQTEARLISAVTTSNVISLSTAPSYSHSKSCPVYETQWNYISFERKASGGSFAAITGSPFAIDWDDHDGETLIYVSDGASTDTFRWRFYNSTTGDYSDYSDELSGGGLAKTQIGYVIMKVRKNPMTQSIDDETMIQYGNDFQTLVYNEIPKAWWFSKEGTSVATTASTYKYNISTNWSDFLSMNYLLYRYINGSTDETYPLTWTPVSEFYNRKADASIPTDDYVKRWTLLPPDSSSAKGYIALDPTPKTATCYLKPVYFFDLTDLDSFGDTMIIPYPKGYEDYIYYRIYDDIKSDKNNADKYYARVMSSIVALKRRSRRQLGQPEMTRFRGHRGFHSLFGENARIDSSANRELFW